MLRTAIWECRIGFGSVCAVDQSAMVANHIVMTVGAPARRAGSIKSWAKDSRVGERPKRVRQDI
jgi:hypothetical protein